MLEEQWLRAPVTRLALSGLAVRYDRLATTVLGLLHLACALICVRFLRRAELAATGS